MHNNDTGRDHLTPGNRTSELRARRTDYAFYNVSNWLVGLWIISFSLFTFSVSAQDESADGPIKAITYIGIEPDIITNYAGDNSKKLGYVRITIEMMIDDPTKIPDIEHHMPLLRATAIEVLGAQPEDKVKSLTGREEIRRVLLQNFKRIMKRETGDEVMRNIIFTKFLRQGG